MTSSDKKTNIKNLGLVEQISGTDLVLVSVNGKARRALASLLKGQKGDDIELQITSSHIQWRLKGGEWVNLISFATLRGPIEDAANDCIDATIDLRKLETEVSGNEEIRTVAETERNTSEQSRQTSEIERVTSENERKAAELLRNTAENTRIQAENGRTTEFETIKADVEKATTAANTATTEANNATSELGVIKKECQLATQDAVGAATNANEAAQEVRDFVNDASRVTVTETDKQNWNDKYTRAETDTRDTAALQAAKEYAAAKIAEIVNSSPSTLDTLQELAAALGNDPNFATSIMALIAGKADNVHAHTTAQITDFPASLPANGGNADTSNILLLTQDRPTHGNGMIINQHSDFKDAPELDKWFSYMRILHGNQVGFFSEIATPFTDSQRMYFRNMIGGVVHPWNAVAYLTDIPTSLPANGGNADTVGGLHAAAVGIVEAGKLASYNAYGHMGAQIFMDNWAADNDLPIGLVGFKSSIEDGYHRFCSLERFKQALGTFITNRGSFGVDELTTFTNRESGTYSVMFPGASRSLIVFRSTGSTSAVEILSGYEEDARLQVRKTIDSNRHTNFKDLAWLTDIPTSLPANGGNANTVGGSPAWRLQSVQKNGELYMANQYDIQSRFNAKEDGRFRLEIVGFGDANLHKDSVSVGYADQANNADTLDGHHYNQFIHVVADRSIHADNVDGSLCGFGYDSNGFPTNGSFISFGGLGNEGKYVTQIQAGYINGNEIYFRTRIDDTTPGINHPWRRIALSDEIPTTTEQITDTAGRRYVTEMEKANWNSKAVGNHSHAGYALASHTHPYAPVDHVHEMTTVLSAMYEFPWNSRNNNVDMNSVMGLWIVSEVIRNSVGQFTVRHTLGHKRYTLILTGGARASDSSAIISVSLVAREAYYFTVQTSVGDQFRDGGFYATILTF